MIDDDDGDGDDDDGDICVSLRITSLSVDYILTLVLAGVLGVKYIVFDHDDDVQSEDAEVTTATILAAEGGGDKLNTSVVMKSSISAGQTEHVDETLHRETSNDITPTPSSLTPMASSVPGVSSISSIHFTL